MTSEEIIQRLLDEKKITVADAMVILKDLAKIGISYVLKQEQPTIPTAPTIVMYGVGVTTSTGDGQSISNYSHTNETPA